METRKLTTTIITLCAAAATLFAQQTDSLVARPWGKTDDYKSGTASVVTGVNMSDVEKSPVYDLRNKLTGIIPGLEVREITGNIMPAESQSSAVLGSSTMGFNSHSMTSIILIVDDVPVPFSEYQFDINQIESMTLLSGATAKAKYGPHASYGALYVKTRKGSYNTPMRVTADLRTSVDFVDRMPEWVNAYEYATLNNQARVEDGYKALYDDETLEGYLAGDMFNRKSPAVDYRSLMMKDSKMSQSFGFDLNGGSNILKFSSSVNGYRSDDIYKVGPVADYDRLNISSSITARIGKWLEANVSFNGMTAFRRANTGGITSFRSVPANAFPVALGISTNDSDLEGVSAGNVIYAVSRSFTTNPYAEIVDGGFSTTRYRSGMFQASLNFDMGWLLKGLYNRTMLTSDNYYSQRVGKDNDYIAYYWSQTSDVGDISSHVGVKQASKSSKSTFTYNNLTFYDRLGYGLSKDGHRLDAGVMFYLANGNNANNSYYQRQAYFIADADYSYMGKYIVELAAQYAGCSRFAPENRYAFFPSVALAWQAGEEDFIKSLGWVNTLKLSADVGSIADANVFGTNYLYRASYLTDSGATYGPATAYQWFGSDKRTGTVTSIERISNHSLKWPRIFQVDLKLEAELFDCLSFSANYYRLDRSDLITDVTSEYPTMLGLSDITYYDNYNAYLTNGLDLALRYHRQWGDWRLSVGGSTMMFTNIYSKYANDNYLYEWQKVTGTSTGSYRGFICLGRFESWEQLETLPLYDSESTIGDLIYKDLNDDGKIDANDKTIIGNTTPKLRYSVNLDLGWKGWNLFLVGTGRAGVDLAYTNEYFWNGWGSGNYSAFVRDNIGGAYPRLGYDKSANNFVASDFWLRDGSYFKLQTAELAYTFNLKRSKAVKSARLSVRGSNLFTLTGVEYVDPESTSAGVTEYPFFRSVAVGAKFTF